MNIIIKLINSIIKETSRAKKNTAKPIVNPIIAKDNKQFVAICPYCRKTLDSMPQRKKKCKHCGNTIFVKRWPDDATKLLMTEESAKKVDAAWNRKAQREEIIETFTRFGFTDKEIQIYINDLRHVNFGDIKWQMFNEALSRNSKDFQRMRQLYYSMALQLVEEGKNPNKMLELSQESELKYLKEVGFKKVKIMASHNSCEQCTGHDNEEFTIDEAFEQKPLPCKDCTSSYGYCRCTFISISIPNG